MKQANKILHYFHSHQHWLLPAGSGGTWFKPRC